MEFSPAELGMIERLVLIAEYALTDLGSGVAIERAREEIEIIRAKLKGTK